MQRDKGSLRFTTGMAATPLCHPRSPPGVSRATVAPRGWLHVIRPTSNIRM